MSLLSSQTFTGTLPQHTSTFYVDLVDDVRHLICANLDLSSRVAFVRTCKKSHALASAPLRLPELWRRAMKSRHYVPYGHAQLVQWAHRSGFFARIGRAHRIVSLQIQVRFYEITYIARCHAIDKGQVHQLTLRVERIDRRREFGWNNALLTPAAPAAVDAFVESCLRVQEQRDEATKRRAAVPSAVRTHYAKELADAKDALAAAKEAFFGAKSRVHGLAISDATNPSKYATILADIASFSSATRTLYEASEEVRRIQSILEGIVKVEAPHVAALEALELIASDAEAEEEEAEPPHKKQRLE